MSNVIPINVREIKEEEKMLEVLTRSRAERYKFAEAVYESNHSDKDNADEWQHFAHGADVLTMPQRAGNVAFKGVLQAGDMLVTPEGSISANHPSVPAEIKAQAPQILQDDTA